MLGRQLRIEIILLALVGETQLSSVPPCVTPSSRSWPLKFFLPDMAPFKDPQPNLIWYIASRPELQRNKDTVTCGAKVAGPCEKKLTPTRLSVC